MDNIVGLTLRYGMAIFIFIMTVNMASTGLDKKYVDLVDNSTMELVDIICVERTISEAVMETYLKRISLRHATVKIRHTNAEERITVEKDILDQVFGTTGRYDLEEKDYIYIEVVSEIYGDERVITRHGGYIE